ncbi:helix-turn-helix domain-containing protein [Saccharopolyspora shandongensis]|uniref:helix-turn-helix domain-containing protein n=1 Tax=Saccharopolyspora shandongensis TaxID=418495 RepID=UPI0033DB9747
MRASQVRGVPERAEPPSRAVGARSVGRNAKENELVKRGHPTGPTGPVVSRAFTLLDSFSTARRALTLSQLASIAGMPLPTAHRLVQRRRPSTASFCVLRRGEIPGGPTIACLGPSS